MNQPRRFKFIFLSFFCLLFLISFVPEALAVFTVGDGGGYADTSACTKSWEFESGLIPNDWKQLKGFVYNRSPADFIAWLFTLALGVAGFLALIMIVVAGIEYTASAGNSGSQTRAKERIQNALLGLGLLLASFVILNTINTSLRNIKNPTLLAQPVGISSQTCTCTKKTTLDGMTTCASNSTGSLYCGYGENCTYEHRTVIDGTKGFEAIQAKTDIYCCKFSDPPTAPGGGGSGGGSCYTTPVTYGCRPNPCASGETCTPGGPGGTPLRCCSGSTCTDFAPAANYSCSPTINGDCKVGETCGFGGPGLTQCCT